MKNIYLGTLLFFCFQSIAYGGCPGFCGCNTGTAEAGEEIQINEDKWPDEPPILSLCCGDSIPAEEVADMLFTDETMPSATDNDKFTLTELFHDQNCNCSTTDTVSTHGDTVILEWSGSIDPCSSGTQTITATFKNPVVTYINPGPKDSPCIEWDENDNCIKEECDDNEVPYSVIETKTRELSITVTPIFETGCSSVCAEVPTDCGAGETYNSATCACEGPEPPCPYPPCEPPCSNPPCTEPCPNPPCEPPCPEPPCTEPCPNPPCEPCPNPPCEPCPNPPCGPFPCPAGQHFDKDLGQCVPDGPECPPGSYRDPATGICVSGPPQCPEGETWDAELGKCVCADDQGRPISDEPCCGEKGGEDCCCEECPNGSCPAENGVGTNGLTLSTSIGTGANGNKNLSLVLSDFLPHQESANPKNLELKHGSYAEEIIYDQNVAFRQILTDNRLVDIVTIAPYKFEIRQYDYADKGTKGPNGLYQPVDSPLKTVIIENPVSASVPDYDCIRVNSAQPGTDPVVDEFYYSPITGTLRVGKALDSVTGKFARVEFRQSSWVSYNSEWIITLTVTDGDGVIASRTHKRYKLFPWGKELIEETAETGLPGHTGYTATWEYYTNPNEIGKYSELKTHVDYRGYWTRYDYDTNGKEIKRVEPFKDSPVTALDSEARVFETTRSTDPVTGAITKLVVEKVLGAVVGREYTIYDGPTETRIVCLSPTATATDPTNLVTVTKRFTNGPLRGGVQSVLNPDGTMRLTSYTYSGTMLVVTTEIGEPNPGKTAIVDGTRTVTATNKAGIAVDTDIYDIASGFQTGGATITEFDALGRAVKTEYLDGTWERTEHGCCNGADSIRDKLGVVTYYTHDKLDRVLTATRQGITHRYTYDAEGRQLSDTRIGTDSTEIIQQTDSYDLYGDLVESKDTYNYITAHYHPGNNLLIDAQTLPNSGSIVTEHYLDGSVKSVSGSASRPSATDYRVENNQRVTRNIVGTTCMTCPNTEWVETFTNLADRPVRKLYPDGAQEFYYYNSKGQLWKSVDPDGIVTLLEYNARGRTIKTVIDTDRDDFIDLAGIDRVLAAERSVINDNGTVKVKEAVSQWQQTGQNAPVVIQTSEKSVSSLDTWESKFGLVTHTSIAIDGLGNSTITTVNPDGSSAVKVRSGDSTVEVKALDALSVQLSKTTYTYDPHGRLESGTDTRNGTTDYQYYNNDLLFSRILPAADASTPRQQETFEYYPAGNLKKKTLADSSEVNYEYFLTGALKRIWGSQTYEQNYSYDFQGRRKTLITSDGTVTTWNYDPERGWLSSKIYDDSNGTNYTYTPAGKLETRTWARGIVTTYDYNNIGELTSIDYSDTTPDVTFTYNRRGLKEEINDVTGARSFGFNIAGAVQWEYIDKDLSDPFDGMGISRAFDTLLRPSYFITSQYNGKGEIQDLTYTYDEASRIESVFDNMSHLEYYYTYEPNSSLVSSLTYRNPSGTDVIKTTGDYDNLSRVTSLVTNRISDNHILASYQYDYNSLNQRTSIERADSSYWDYGYDALGQVISGKKKLAGGTQIDGYIYEYDFDGIGNRESATVNGKTQTYTANALNQYTQRTVPGFLDVVGEADPAATVYVNGHLAARQGKHYSHEFTIGNGSQPVNLDVSVSAQGGGGTTVLENETVYVAEDPEAYSYDDDGNLITDGRWTYTWDAENRLIGMESIASVPAVAKKKIAYQYDYMGRRITKTVQEWDAQTSTWLSGDFRKFYYDDWNLVGEVQGTQILGKYVWGIDLSGSLQGAGGVGGLLAIERAGGTVFVVSDANGNVTHLVDAVTRDVVGEYEYGPFGEVLRESGPAAEVNPFRFSSKYEDAESGLVYYGFRYYDAGVGRWLNRDPIGEDGGLNLYCILNNSSINVFDLFGKNQLTPNQKVDAILRIMKNRKFPTAYKALSNWKKRKQNDKTFVPISIAWVLKFAQVKNAYQTLIETADSENSKKEIKKILAREKITCGPFDFTDMGGNIADDHQNRVNGGTIRNYYNQSSSKTNFSLPDDLEASLGRFQFRLTVKGEVCNGRIKVEGGGVYVQDEYHFRDGSWISQQLGYWGEPDYIGISERSGAFRVDNKLFQDWRIDNMPYGGDYQIYTDQKPVKLDFEF